MNARIEIGKYLRDRNIKDDIWYTVCSHYLDSKCNAVLDDFKDKSGRYTITEKELHSEMKAFVNYYQKMNFIIKWSYIHSLPNTKKLIAEFEEIAAIHLPIWYIYLVQKYNNGRPNINCININGKEVILKSLVSFEKEDKEKIWDLIRDNGIIFANDNFGNSFCFNTTDSGITFVNHETGEKISVCESFLEFIDMLS